jgi:hypothetical protein
MAQRVVIKNARISYCNLLQARETMDGSGEEWSTQIIIDKDDDQVEALEKLAQDELEAKFGPKAKFGKLHRSPLRDGDEDHEDDPIYVNKVFLNARAKRRAPQIVDRHLEPVTHEDDVYSGCYANVSVNFFAYDTSGSKGVGVGLNNVQVLEKAERLDGAVAAQDEFSEVD